MVAYIVFVSLHSVFIHANLGFRFGWLRYVFATPQFHHWHHGAEPEAIDKNFAVHVDRAVTEATDIENVSLLAVIRLAKSSLAFVPNSMNKFSECRAK